MRSWSRSIRRPECRPRTTPAASRAGQRLLRRGFLQRRGQVYLCASFQEPAMRLTPPALDPQEITPRTHSGYPEPYRSRVLPRSKRPLGDALGLTRIGVNLTTLSPGKESSMRHWHSHEEELIYVLEGELVLRTDAGEQTLTPGMCA